LLVGLKLRLLVNGFRQGGMRAVAMIAGAAAGLLTVVVGSTLIVVLGAKGGANARAGAVVGLAVLLVLWCLAPLLTMSADETLDASRLAALPLRPGQLLVGSAAAAAVGIGPFVAWALLAATVAAFVRDLLTAVVVPLAVVLAGASSLLAGRAVGAALARVMSSRRGRDVAVSLLTLLALSVALLQLAVRHLSHAGSDALQHAARWVGWTPPGWAGRAIAAAMEGRAGVAALCILAALALTVFCAFWWAASLGRAMVDPGDGDHRSRERSAASTACSVAAAGGPAIIGRIPALPATSWAAVTARELRYLVRDPRRRVQLLVSVVLGVAFPLSIVLTARNRTPAAVLVAGVGGYLVVFNTLNQFGVDGAAGWLDVVAGNRARAVLVGKNVAVGGLGVALVSVASVVLAAYTGGWGLLAASVLLGSAALVVGLGVANVTSVLVPVALPEQGNPFAGAGAGQGCLSAPLLSASLMVQGALIAPLVVAVALLATHHAAAATLVAVAGLLYAVLLWRLGVRLAAERAGTHQPELLEAVDPRRRA
jgi:ABC-2 type transport system permease protein